ncbi:MAG: helix-turn-helix domain-containing protein [Prevotella sp.]|nr:helix-turn-helix domain-containing protein [Staphylococcus sp.]MCM1351007.1 helix-turn-helix domain-containing protein [Prevotella sp.]
MTNIHTNIKVLREEARLTQQEFAEKLNVSEETVALWEKGKLDPTSEQIRKMCPILRIHEEDFLERDILAERTDAGNRMKKGKDRSSYNWYLGNRLSMTFYISYLIIIPIVGILVGAITKSLAEETAKQMDFIVNTTLPAIVYAIIAMGFISAIYIYIFLFKRGILHFRWWYIFWISFISIFSILIGSIATPFLYGYAFYKGVIRKGKNR